MRAAVQLGAAHDLVKPSTFAWLAERLTACRRLAERLASMTEAGQEDVDALYVLFRAPAGGHAQPKGQTSVTLTRVLTPCAATAAPVADEVGISRPTAHRYLNQLTADGTVELDLDYSSGGWPEHRYRIAD